MNVDLNLVDSVRGTGDDGDVLEAVTRFVVLPMVLAVLSSSFYYGEYDWY